jgi:lipase maturation factor 1
MPLSESQTSYRFARWIFLRFLAAIYFIAFISLWTQIIGLVGSQGIIPAKDFLRLVQENIDYQRYWLLPTLFWVNASDIALHLVCAAGTILSFLLLLGWTSTPALFVLWFLYLSLSGICRDFLSFQWDVLLLEIGFLAIFLNAPRFFARDRRNSTYTKEAMWLFWWLLFRLVFSSGVVKLTSGDPSWKNLTALTYHYETQPLPTWIGWYAHQLPAWFQSISTVTMFVIELIFPIFILLPGRLKRIGSGGIIFLQVLILLTGNYCFFNLLTIALCLLVIEDRFVPSRWLAQTNQTDERTWPRLIVWPVCVFLGLLSFLPLIGSFRERIPWPNPVLQTYGVAQRFYLVNGYGLFAVMTKNRQEIILEGSNDGSNWQTYEFKYKPGDPSRRPQFVAPHQPRLDWQMWFAALETYQSNRWFIPFCYRLLDGSPQVLSLLAKNPFPGKPPRYLRARLFNYHFTNWNMKSKQGTWWRGEYVEDYCPVMSKQ